MLLLDWFWPMVVATLQWFRAVVYKDLLWDFIRNRVKTSVLVSLDLCFSLCASDLVSAMQPSSCHWYCFVRDPFLQSYRFWVQFG